MADKKRLVLIDGHSTLYKSYHGIEQPLSTSKGEPTSAVYAFLNTFMRLRQQLGFEHVIMVFDPPGKTFRSGMFAEYKAHRPPMPDDLRAQEKRVRELMAALAVPVCEVPGFEADDVIAALAMRAVDAGGEALVVSSDKDLLQIVRPGITIFREHLRKLEVLDVEGVIAKLGIRPDQVPAYLGLVGDTADNIPGVPKIGAKTAAGLLQEYGTLEAILAAEPPYKVKLNKAQAENLKSCADVARLSTQLATLDPACIPGFDWEQARWSYNPGERARDFFREMEFYNHLKELGGDTVEERTVSYETITTRAALEKAAAAIRAAGQCAIDTETTDLDPWTSDLVGISLSWKKNCAAYLPVGHSSAETQLPIEDARAVLNPLLADPSIKWVAHHAVFDLKFLKMARFAEPALTGDTMIANYLLHPERTGTASLRLKDMAVQHLGIQMTQIAELIGSGDDMVTMASVTVEDSSRYACQDADVTLQLHELLLPRVAQSGMESLYRTIEVPLIPVLAAMELEGVRLDVPYFQSLASEWRARLDTICAEIHELAGRPFNINSPKQVGELLFGEMNLTPIKKTKSGHSTDAATLEALKHEHPIVSKLLDSRQFEKLLGTYIEPLPRMVNARTGRLHTSYNQTIAATGRLSSTDPNLQNIPIRTEEGRRIRGGFLPRAQGWKLVSADYSQIELRILAHLSGDEVLCSAFRGGLDIHTITASRMFGVPEGDVTPEMRSRAKIINFGIIYGVSAFRLSNEFKISKGEAQQFIDEYFRLYAGVKKFIDDTVAFAQQHNYVTTMAGRRRPVGDINARNFTARAAAERIAVNTPVQGASADMIKAAMIRVARRLDAGGFRARMILQVHDELIFDAPEEEVARLSAMVTEEMAGALPLNVPVRVDVSVGDNWGEC